MVGAMGTPVRFILSGGAARGMIGAAPTTPSLRGDPILGAQTNGADARIGAPRGAAGQTEGRPSHASQSRDRVATPSISPTSRVIASLIASLKPSSAVASRSATTTRHAIAGRAPTTRRGLLGQMGNRPSTIVWNRTKKAAADQAMGVYLPAPVDRCGQLRGQ